MRIRHRLFAALSVVAALAASMAAQRPVETSSLPAFDAISVKPVKPAGAWGPPVTHPQRLLIAAAPLGFIIQQAWGIDRFQLGGVPDWANHEFFAINASTSTPVSREQMLTMLRRALADRFQLRMSLTPTTARGWAITLAPGGPKLGKPLAADEPCATNYPLRDHLKDPELAHENFQVGFFGCTMTDLVHGLASRLNQPVADQTGVSGRYSYFVWQRIDSAAAPNDPARKVNNVEPFEAAVQRELGVRLVAKTVPVAMYAVTGVARPGPD